MKTDKDDRELEPAAFTSDAVMLAKSYDPERVESWKSVVVEPKLDGIRVIILFDVRKAKISFHSRNGRHLNMFRHLCNEVQRFAMQAAGTDPRFWSKGTMLDGEMVSATGKFGDISGSIHRKEFTAEDARFACFHAMPISLFREGKDDVPQSKRAKMVRKILERKEFELLRSFEATPVEGDDDVQKVNVKNKRRGFEGSMVKNHAEPWTAGRSYAWMKIKDEETYDVTITGAKEGKGKYEGTLGALICDYKGHKVQVSGMTDDERNDFWKRREKLVGKVVEVKCQQITEDGALRHPRFVRMRDDKS